MQLNKNLEVKTLHYTIHHKYLNETVISNILKITGLIINDFSSIILGIMNREKYL